jgi:hypothetical protein
MKKKEQIQYLKENHFSEWYAIREQTAEKFSDERGMYCICGKLLTGLHERTCQRFNNHVDDLTAAQLEHLLPNE